MRVRAGNKLRKLLGGVLTLSLLLSGLYLSPVQAAETGGTSLPTERSVSGSDPGGSNLLGTTPTVVPGETASFGTAAPKEGGTGVVPRADSIGNGEELAKGDFSGWSWNVFGNSTSIDASSVTTSADGTQTATLAVTNNKGKIASKNDGICFLNQQLSSGTDNFILNATANVASYDKNNQVAFGLMMRSGVGITTSEANGSDGVLRHVFVGMVNQSLRGSVRNGSFTATPFQESTLATNTDYDLTLQKQGNTVTLVCNNEVQTVDLSGNSYDNLDLYVGLFVARNCNVTFSNVSLQVISADQTPELAGQPTLPTKTTYIKGNTMADIDLSGFSAEVKVGGETRTITGSDCRVVSGDFDAVGDSKIVLNYLGLEIEIPVEVIIEVLEDLTLNYPPTKTDYFIGDEIDWTGLGAVAAYNSGVTKDVLEDLINKNDAETEITGFDSTTAGEKTVTITHTHGDVSKSISFKVNISDAALAGIDLSGPTKMIYYTDGTYNTGDYKAGLRVIATYSDGTKDIFTDMNSAGISISPDEELDITNVGEKAYTVSYTVGGVTKTAVYTLKVVTSQVTGVKISEYPKVTTFARGAEFSSEGLKVVSVKDSGVETVLQEGEYEIDYSAFQKDTLGSYTITITEKVSGHNYTTSYTATVADKTSFGYEDLEWNEILFGQSVSNGSHPVYDAATGTIIVELEEGKGKITDAGQDGISYYYTTVNADQNFVLTAQVKVDYFITKSSPDNQEGFGIMVRDAIGTNDDASIFYSSAASVGGYFGRYNVFGRYGITPLDVEGFTNFYAHGKTSSIGLTYQVKEDAPKTFTMTLAKDNTGIWATMLDESGNDVLARGYLSNSAVNGSVHTDTANPYRVYMPADTFTSVDPEKIYVGFMAARGAKLEVDTSTINMTITSAASDAPQEVLPAAPVKPAVSVKSLSTASESDYTLKLNVNTLGLLTVKLNGSIVKKQMDITEAGTVELPLTLIKGNNAVQLIFEPDPTQNITSSDTITTNYTITYKTYGEASNALYISPDGSSGGDGTRENPLDLKTAAEYCQPGQAIYALGGTYIFKSTQQIRHDNDGREDAMKELIAAPDNTEEVVFDFNGTSGTFNISGDYWHIKGISVTNGAGIRVGGSHNTIELCRAYNNTETGLQISRTDSAKNIEDWPSYNLILNCDAYNNRDASDNNADGFAAKLTSGYGNVFRGCVACFNVDDGWDLFAKASAIGAVKLYDCIAYGNGYCINADGSIVATKGDGNGFKLGGSGVPVSHEIHNSISFGNAANGFTNNSNPIYNVFNCIGYNNGGSNLEYHAYTNATPQVAVDGFISYADSTISDFTVMGDKTTDSDHSNNGVVKAGNYLYNSKTGQSMDALGAEVVETSFVDLSKFILYCTNQLRYARDEEGNLVLGDFLKFIEPVVTIKPEEGSGIDAVKAGSEGVTFVYRNEDGTSGKVVTNGEVVIKATPGETAPSVEGLAEAVYRKIAEAGAAIADAKIVYYDIAAYLGDVKVTISEGSVKIKFPYPDGYTKDNEIIVLHYTDAVVVEKEEDGFWITADGFSPYTFIYLSKAGGDSSDDDSPVDSEDGKDKDTDESVPDNNKDLQKSPKTGDAGNGIYNAAAMDKIVVKVNDVELPHVEAARNTDDQENPSGAEVLAAVTAISPVAGLVQPVEDNRFVGWLLAAMAVLLTAGAAGVVLWERRKSEQES